MKATFWGLGLALFLAAAPAAAIENRLGLGVHVWRSAGELWDHPTNGGEHDLTALLSYQLVLWRPLKLQLDVEYFDNGFGGAGLVALFPQGLIVVGDRLYVAVGAGWIYPRDLEGNLSNVVYLARLGIDLPVRSRLHLDLYVQQRAEDASRLTAATAETITFGTVVRFRM